MAENKKTGRLYLIPSFLGENDNSIIPDQVRQVVEGLSHFIVEDARTARRYLRAIGYKKNFDTEVTIQELDKHGANHAKQLLAAIEDGHDMGIISEAGNPCIADPGYEIVSYAHIRGYQVRPLVGPSSILLALVASGFSGQQFSFHGYLPIQSGDRIRKLRQLEESIKKGGTQIFMETPFRNDAMLRDALQHLGAETKLCVACDLTLPTEYIATKKVSDWRRQVPELHKRYCIFLIG